MRGAVVRLQEHFCLYVRPLGFVCSMTFPRRKKGCPERIHTAQQQASMQRSQNIVYGLRACCLVFNAASSFKTRQQAASRPYLLGRLHGCLLSSLDPFSTLLIPARADHSTPKRPRSYQNKAFVQPDKRRLVCWVQDLHEGPRDLH